MAQTTINNGSTLLAIRTALNDNFTELYAAIPDAGENYVSDAELTVLQATSGSNTGDQSAGDFNHDDLANITGTVGEYNHPTDAQMSVLDNTITKTATAANAFSAGTVGYLISAGTVTLADADAEVSSKGMLLMATESISGGASGSFSRGGDVTVTSHGFTVGAPLFISATAGEFTETAPSTTGQFVRFVGYAIDLNTISFQPDATWVEVA